MILRPGTNSACILSIRTKFRMLKFISINDPFYRIGR
jgi:hypothetical protein